MLAHFHHFVHHFPWFFDRSLVHDKQLRWHKYTADDSPNIFGLLRFASAAAVRHFALPGCHSWFPPTRRGHVSPYACEWGNTVGKPQTLHAHSERATGPTVHHPETCWYGPKMYLRVSRAQSHLFPRQPLGCTWVRTLCARVPPGNQPFANRAQFTNTLSKSQIRYFLWHTGPNEV